MLQAGGSPGVPSSPLGEGPHRVPLHSLAGRLPSSSPAVRAHASQGAGPELTDPKAAEGGLRGTPGAPTLSPPGRRSISISFLLSGLCEKAEAIPAPCPPSLSSAGGAVGRGGSWLGGPGGLGRAGRGAWERPWRGPQCGEGGGVPEASASGSRRPFFQSVEKYCENNLGVGAGPGAGKGPPSAWRPD